MGRKKIQIKPISNAKTKQVTLAKRRTGLIKKAMELAILCGVDVCLIISPPHGERYQYSTQDMQGAQRLFDDFQRFTTLRSHDYSTLFNAEVLENSDDEKGQDDTTTNTEGFAPILPSSSGHSFDTSPTKQALQITNTLKRSNASVATLAAAASANPLAGSQGMMPVAMPSPFPGAPPFVMMMPTAVLGPYAAMYAEALAKSQGQSAEKPNDEPPLPDANAQSEEPLSMGPTSMQLSRSEGGDTEPQDPLHATPPIDADSDLRNSTDDLRIDIPMRNKGYSMAPRSANSDSPPVVSLPASLGGSPSGGAPSIAAPQSATGAQNFTFSFPVSSSSFSPTGILTPGTSDFGNFPLFSNGGFTPMSAFPPTTPVLNFGTSFSGFPSLSGTASSFSSAPSSSNSKT